MKRKKTVLVLFSFFVMFNLSCSGGSGAGVPFFPLSPQASSSVSQQKPNDKTEDKTAPSKPVNNNPQPEKRFAEPITETKNPDPKTQFKSYEKMTRAIQLGDFDYLIKEYEAGGLKIAAIRSDTEFNDYPLDYTAKSIMQNIGQVGINNRNISTINSEEKKAILDKIFKQVLIYSLKGSANKLIENNRIGLIKEDKDTTDIARHIFEYFYGNDDGSISANSIAKLSQTIDSSNAISSNKTYDSISSAIKQMKVNAKGNIKNLILGKNQIDKSFYKLLYLATLEKIASTENMIKNKNTNAGNELTAAEFLYIGIRNPSKVLFGKNNGYPETIFSNKRLDLLDYDKFVENINAGFNERVIEDMKHAMDTMITDNSSAQNFAFSAQLYLDITNCSYKNIGHSRVSNSQLTVNIQNFKSAIQSKNSAKAKELFDKMGSALYWPGV